MLFFHVVRHKRADLKQPRSDRPIPSKGRAVPGLSAAWADLGRLSEADRLSLRKMHSDLEGHPTSRSPLVDVATDSPGQGLGAACRTAHTGKYLEEASNRVFCRMGHCESSEGSSGRLWPLLPTTVRII